MPIRYPAVEKTKRRRSDIASIFARNILLRWWLGNTAQENGQPKMVPIWRRFVEYYGGMAEGGYRGALKGNSRAVIGIIRIWFYPPEHNDAMERSPERTGNRQIAAGAPPRRQHLLAVIGY